jgi:RNA polymerase sigma-70 factor (ECF subfamily)
LEATQTESQGCLIEQARTDKSAFAALFRRHYDEIYRYCARRLPSAAVAEDITSQVFLKMVKTFSNFMGDEKAFRCWLFRIACNEINSHYRKAGRQTKAYEKIKNESPTELADTTDDCDSKEEAIAKREFLAEAIGRLKPEHQDIVSLRFYEGLNSTEIGDVLEMKPATVRSQLARALKTIKEYYQNRQQQTPGKWCWYE